MCKAENEIVDWQNVRHDLRRAKGHEACEDRQSRHVQLVWEFAM